MPIITILSFEQWVQQRRYCADLAEVAPSLAGLHGYIYPASAEGRVFYIRCRFLQHNLRRPYELRSENPRRLISFARSLQEAEQMLYPIYAYQMSL